MKYLVVLLSGLIQIPFFPNLFNVFSFGFVCGMFVAMLVNDSVWKR